MILDRFYKTIREMFTPANIAPISLRDIWLEPQLTPDDIANYCEIVDQNSPITVICFAGLALGYAGLPSYEFRKSLGAVGNSCNIIFIRDVRRFWYHLTPEGHVDGLDFYTTQLQAHVHALGTQSLITIGVSAGGYAALYFGWRLGADQVLAFSPQTDLINYRNLNPLKRLKRDRDNQNLRSYLKEEFMVALTLRRRTRLLSTKLPTTDWGRLDSDTLSKGSSQAHVYYCQQNGLDAQEALKVAALDGVTLHACDCNQHNAAGYLRDRGQLFSILQATLADVTQQ
jgi:hypothetical protein